MHYAPINGLPVRGYSSETTEKKPGELIILFMQSLLKFTLSPRILQITASVSYWHLKLITVLDHVGRLLSKKKQEGKSRTGQWGLLDSRAYKNDKIVVTILHESKSLSQFATSFCKVYDATFRLVSV